MTRAGGVSIIHSTKAQETQGAKNRKGEFDDRDADVGVGSAVQRTNAAAGWSGGRMPPDGTARPANAAGTRNAKPQERWPTGLSAASAAGGKPTGPVEVGGPASPRPRVPRAPDRLAHFSEQVCTGQERLEKREPKRARMLRRAPQRKTDARRTHR